MEKSPATGFQGEKSTTSRDLGAGSGDVNRAGTGYIERKKSGQGGQGGGSAPKDAGTGYIRKAEKGAGSSKRIADGVGGPLPSA